MQKIRMGNQEIGELTTFLSRLGEYDALYISGRYAPEGQPQQYDSRGTFAIFHIKGFKVSLTTRLNVLILDGQGVQIYCDDYYETCCKKPDCEHYDYFTRKNLEKFIRAKILEYIGGQ